MSKKQDKNYVNLILSTIQNDKDVTSLDSKAETIKTGSLIVPIEDYLETIAPEHFHLTSEHKIGSYPELFQIRGLENDRASTVPELNISKPVKMFTALYKANIESILTKAKERQKQTN